MALTPKQQAFAREYLVDLDATGAALRAGYSAGAARRQGGALLRNGDVVAAIARGMGARGMGGHMGGHMEERAEGPEISAGRVLAEIAAMAFWDPADLMVEPDGAAEPGESAEAAAGEAEAGGAEAGYRLGEDGRLHGLRGPADIRRLPGTIRRAIIGWGWDRQERFTVKLADKAKALDQLARHLSLYHDRLDLNVTGDLASRLHRARERHANERRAKERRDG